MAKKTVLERQSTSPIKKPPRSTSPQRVKSISHAPTKPNPSSPVHSPRPIHIRSNPVQKGGFSPRGLHIAGKQNTTHKPSSKNSTEKAIPNPPSQTQQTPTVQVFNTIHQPAPQPSQLPQQGPPHFQYHLQYMPQPLYPHPNHSQAHDNSPTHHESHDQMRNTKWAKAKLIGRNIASVANTGAKGFQNSMGIASKFATNSLKDVRDAGTTLANGSKANLGMPSFRLPETASGGPSSVGGGMSEISMPSVMPSGPGGSTTINAGSSGPLSMPDWSPPSYQPLQPSPFPIDPSNFSNGIPPLPISMDSTPDSSLDTAPQPPQINYVPQMLPPFPDSQNFSFGATTPSSVRPPGLPSMPFNTVLPPPPPYGQLPPWQQYNA